MLNINQILISRRYLLVDTTQEEAVDRVSRAYYSAYLFANFGILVDKPELLSAKHVQEISSFYKLKVPASFYKNPQDTRYYSSEELFVNQVISYFLAYGAENSTVDLFADEKQLPEYKDGEEIKVREFKILTKMEVAPVLRDIVRAYCEYKRPWSLDEADEFNYLYDRGYYANEAILCGDNAVSMLEKDIVFAKFLYKKDLVKLSIARCGERSKLVMDAYTRFLIRRAIPFVKDCPMSKKQAKYFNKLVAETGVIGVNKATNQASPYKAAKEAIDRGDILEAAKIYAANGSLFERNIKMLISRANPAEVLEIIKMIPAKNPIALYQFANTLIEDTGDNRTFTFIKNRLVKRHVETDYEAKWRKSKLNEATRKFVHDAIFAQIETAYRSQNTLGKVYISDDFYKIGVPVNTSTSGRGIDVLPTGSRIPVRGDNIRTFVHWEHAFDIDSSLIVVDKNGSTDCVGWFNYERKSYGNDILFSGDVTSPTGTEYFDIASISKLRAKGIKYIVQTFHGYCSNLNSGEIYCGYQDIKDLNTKAWNPKNIELKIHVKGNTRACIGFAIDLETQEVVVLNQLIEDDSRVVNGDLFKVVGNYLQPSCLELNMGKVISYRATELVDNPEEAEIVCDATYKAIVDEEGRVTQKVIRPYDIEKLAAIATGASV